MMYYLLFITIYQIFLYITIQNLGIFITIYSDYCVFIYYHLFHLFHLFRGQLDGFQIQRPTYTYYML